MVSTLSRADPSKGRSEGYIILTPEDYRVLGERDFGAPGLEAIEVIGPFVDIRACGPLITVHDSTVDPHLGIGHHRHRYNERLFYIMAGELDHDDSLNDIQGHMGPGDVGLFTEGKYGMVHSEWNNGDVPALAYILVYTTDPIPEETSFTALRDSEAPRYEESDGVTTKELVGTRSRLRVHGDIRLFTDSELEEGAVLTLTLDDGEGGLLAIRQGEVQVDDDRLQEGATVLVPPAAGVRTLAVRAASAAQIFRAVFGPGHGLVRAADVPAGRR